MCIFIVLNLGLMCILIMCNVYLHCVEFGVYIMSGSNLYQEIKTILNHV